MLAHKEKLALCLGSLCTEEVQTVGASRGLVARVQGVRGGCKELALAAHRGGFRVWVIGFGALYYNVCPEFSLRFGGLFQRFSKEFQSGPKRWCKVRRKASSGAECSAAPVLPLLARACSCMRACVNACVHA